MFQRASFCRGLVVASVTMTYGDSPWSQMNERIWAVKKKSSLSFFKKNLNFSLWVLELELEAVFLLETRFTYWEQINCCKLI
jgi:hypothetical protein